MGKSGMDFGMGRIGTGRVPPSRPWDGTGRDPISMGLGRDGTRIQWDAVGLGPESVGRVPSHYFHFFRFFRIFNKLFSFKSVLQILSC